MRKKYGILILAKGGLSETSILFRKTLLDTVGFYGRP